MASEQSETTDCLPYGYEVLIAETSVPSGVWFGGWGEGGGSRFPSILGMEQKCCGAPLSSGHQKR